LEDKKSKEEQRQWNIRKRKEKKALEPKTKPLLRLQRKVNTLVRLIDKGHVCISSGRKSGQMQAGHYWSVGSHPELRFHLFNIWAQTATDNNYHSGNPVGYKDGIINAFGDEVFELITGLKGQFTDVSLMKHEIEMKITVVNELIRQMNKRHEVDGILSHQERIDFRIMFNKKIGIYE